MPNFGSYSPWQDAGDNAFQPAGQALNQLALEIAKSRYNKRNEAAMLGLQLEKLQQQHLLDTAHEGAYKAQAGLNDARTQHQQSVDDAARVLQAAVYNRDYPHPLQGGPTVENERLMLNARQHSAMARVAALHGTPQEAFPVHNIGANQVAMDPTTGDQVGQGPIQLAPGGMYQMPGQEPVVNQRPYFAPAGSTPFTQAGQPSGPQTDFRPQASGSRSSAVDAALVRGIVSGELDPSSPLYNAAMKAATNVVPAQATSPAPVAQPAATRPQHSPDEEALLKDANDAIAKGADPEKVKARLKQMGYNPN